MRVIHGELAALLLPVIVLATPMLLLSAGDDLPKSARTDKEPESVYGATIVNRIIAGEKLYNTQLREYSPRIESYVQYYEGETDLGEVPKKDAYYLGRLHVAADTKEITFLRESFWERLRHRVDVIGDYLHLNEFAVEPLAVDHEDFDRDHYMFSPVRWEYLGDVRCLALDVHPRRKSEGRPFEGRIWVEDHNYAVVRLNGTRLNAPFGDLYVHFDCWRENLRPGVWLPVYIFSDETDLGGRLRYKAETRLWGYNITTWRLPQGQAAANTSERPPKRPKHSDEMSTDESQRRLEIAAERNALKRLERAGLIAPPGPVNKVLETVVNNLEISNHLDKLPPIECRVLLTSTLESFSLAYTIVLSRGLIDVLPDEASLAMMLAHELAHITLTHGVNSQYAVRGGMDVPDEKLLPSMDLARNRQDETAADSKAMEYLKNSPYKDELKEAGLFLEEATRAARHTPHLFGAHVGNGLTAGRHKMIRMPDLKTKAPALAPMSVDQIAALPLGSRVQVNAWDGSITFTTRKAVPLIAPSEKMPFEVTLVVPHLQFYDQMPKADATSDK